MGWSDYVQVQPPPNDPSGLPFLYLNYRMVITIPHLYLPPYTISFLEVGNSTSPADDLLLRGMESWRYHRIVFNVILLTHISPGVGLHRNGSDKKRVGWDYWMYKTREKHFTILWVTTFSAFSRAPHTSSCWVLPWFSDWLMSTEILAWAAFAWLEFCTCTEEQWCERATRAAQNTGECLSHGEILECCITGPIWKGALAVASQAVLGFIDNVML